MLFRKKQDRLKSEPYSELLSEKAVQETDHTITLDLGKVIQKFDLSISLGDKKDTAGFENAQHSAERLKQPTDK